MVSDNRATEINIPKFDKFTSFGSTSMSITFNVLQIFLIKKIACIL